METAARTLKGSYLEPDFIPEKAIEVSKTLRTQSVKDSKGHDKPAKQTGSAKDPYSEERVSPTEPSNDDAKHGQPDTRVPGG